MRPRTLILLILVLIVGAVAAFLVITNLGGVTLLGGDETVEAPVESSEFTGEPGEPLPTATPVISFETVVVALVDIPVGQRIRPELITTESRPSDNIALQGGVTFNDPEDESLIGGIVKVPITEGQEILRPMVAQGPTDISATGSDLALYVGEAGKVAVAFPIDKFSGIAYTMRPGDLVDLSMSVGVVAIDEEFASILPNSVERVMQGALVGGTPFLFPKNLQGRLEFLTEINQVAEFVPNQTPEEGQNFEPTGPIPKRVTQLTIQQAEVVWVGTWRDPREFDVEEVVVTDDSLLGISEAPAEGGEVVSAEPTPVPERFESRPDVVILVMFSQDALALKWALERGVDIDLALRAQGDTTPYVTTAISLPQILDQGILALPEPSEIDLEPRPDEVPRPSLPPNPPSN